MRRVAVPVPVPAVGTVVPLPVTTTCPLSQKRLNNGEENEVLRSRSSHHDSRTTMIRHPQRGRRIMHRHGWKFALILAFTVFLLWQWWWLLTNDQTSQPLQESLNNNNKKKKNNAVIPPLHYPSTTIHHLDMDGPPSPPRRRWAYVFLLGAIDPNQPEQYIGMLYNIIIATYNLRHEPPQPPLDSSQTTTTTFQQQQQQNNKNRTRTTSNTTTDVIVMVTFSIYTTAPHVLPLAQVQLLQALNIHIHYLPTSSRPERRQVQNFYTVNFEKFATLSLTQYSRVMYLDSDVMPFCSLDYLFHLSEPLLETISSSSSFFHGDKKKKTDEDRSSSSSSSYSSFERLEENVILAWRNSPAHGGIFVLRPFVGAWEQVQDIIEQREREALTLPWPHFNETLGWGHVIDVGGRDGDGDQVRILHSTNRNKKGIGGGGKEEDHSFTNETRYRPWDWYGAQADQGLLYYWTKYVQRKVSIIIGEEIETWSSSSSSSPASIGKQERHGRPSDHEMPELQNRWTNQPLLHYSCLPKGMHKRGSYGYTGARFSSRSIPYIDLAHFTGQSKPWEQSLASSKALSLRQTHKQHNTTVPLKLHDATEYWFYILSVVLKKEEYYANQTLIQDMDRILDTIQGHHPPVGHATGTRQMILAARGQQAQNVEEQ